MQREKLGSAARQVPGAVAAPFKAFGHWSLYLDKQRRRPEVKQVAGSPPCAGSPATFSPPAIKKAHVLLNVLPDLVVWKNSIKRGEVMCHIESHVWLCRWQRCMSTWSASASS